jgi:predicted nucleotidyltransferase
VSLSNIRDGELKQVFQALEQTFQKTGTDFYVIGALAKDIWFKLGNKTMRMTRDVDFAVLVGSKEEYETVRNYLIEHHHFVGTKENAFVLIAPGNVQVDLLPFGEIAIQDAVHIEGQGLTSIRVNGFAEVYQQGTEEMQLETGHQFQIATLPSIVLLKLIAYDDRPERRLKDPRDIANIIDVYFDLQADHIYTNHLDQFTDENDQRTPKQIAALVIGKEIKQLVKDNPELLNRLSSILEAHLNAGEDSQFIRQMVQENKMTVEENMIYLITMYAGLRQ